MTDRGFLLGDAVYETMRTYEGRLFALDAHLARLCASFDGVKLQNAPSVDGLKTALREVVHSARAETAQELVVRMTVTRGPGAHGMSPRGSGPPQVYILARALPDAPASLYDNGLRLITAKTRRLPAAAQDPRIKAASALNLIMARIEADEADADDALLCDLAGRYLEASSANLIVIKGNSYYSPRGEDGVLEGVTAGLVMDLLDDEGLQAVRGPIDPDVLGSADEVLLTQTTREVLPVASVDGALVNTGQPGRLARTLRSKFLAEVPRWLDP